MENKSRVINTQKLFLLNMHHFIAYVFGGEILPITAILSMAFIFMPFSVLVYFFLMPIMLMMAYKLAFDVLAETAQGNMSPKIRHNYLVTNAIAVKVFVVALLVEAGLWALNREGLNEQYHLYFILFTAFITPAIYMSLALTNSLVFSLNPINLFKIIKTTHLSYLLFVLFWLATIGLHEHIINPYIYKHFPLYLNGIVTTFIEYTLLVLNFHIMGYILFQHRREFDLEGIGFKKIDDDHIEIETIKINPAHAVIKQQLENDNVERALAMIIQQQKEGDRSAAIQDLYKQAIDMKLYSPTNLDVAHKIHNRLRDGLNSQALKMVIAHLDAGEEYTEISPEDINQLARYAIVANKVQYIAPLVKGFHDKYPYHNDIVPNYFLLAKTLYEKKETRGKAKELLVGLIKQYPKDINMNEVKAWFKGLQLMEERKNNS